jgi:sarcosine oxidase subunit gamma
MIERISALIGIMKPGRFGNAAPDARPVLVAEMYGRRLIQATAWAQTAPAMGKALKKATGCTLPRLVGETAATDGLTVMRVGPRRFWLACERRFELDLTGFTPSIAAVVELTDSRTILRIEGRHTRDVLARGLPIDTDRSAFPSGTFVQSVIAHVPVLVHQPPSINDEAFEIYVPSGYARSFLDWLKGAATEFGCEIA